MRPSSAWLLVAMAFAATPDIPVSGQSSPNAATSRLQVAVTFAPRLSLHVSARVLTFQVTGSAPAEASVDLAAGVRIAPGTAAELVADVDAHAPGALTIVTGPDGTTPVSLMAGASTVVAKWVGSGLRSGRLTFRLEAPPGVYQIPVELRLKTD